MMNSSLKKRQAKKTRILIITIIVIAAVAVGGYFLWKQLPDQTVTTAISVDSTSKDYIDTVEYGGSMYQYNDHLSNYLFMGIDTREEVSSYTKQNDAGQADAIFLVSMDRVTENIQILVIPRDTMARIEVFNPSGKSLGTTKDHINIQYAYGDGKEESCKLMSNAVSNLLGNIPIQKYCSLNMDGIPMLADAVGGVTVIVPDSSLESQNPEFREGAVVELTGENTETFIRYRDTAQQGSAMVRQERQTVFMKAFMEKAREKAAKNASFVFDLYEELEPYTVTNMSNDLFAELLVASENATEDIKIIPGDSIEGQNFDEYQVNETELKKLLIKMFYKKIG